MNHLIKRLLFILLFSFIFPLYQVGDQISQNDQDRYFDICYGAEEHGFNDDSSIGDPQLSLGDLNGYTNGTGIFYVTMIDMAASWCTPCWNAIGQMAAIEDWYSNNPNVVVITNLDDIGQPYSCQQWGDHHQDFNEDVIPLMTDDGNQDVIWSWLQTGSAFPSTAYIDHTMTVFHKANNPSFGTAISVIDNMVSECGDLCTLSPPVSLFEYSVSGNTVSFFDLSEFASEGWIISNWSWDFGDGNISNEQNPVHTYMSDGIYTVSLFIETDIGVESNIYSEDIQIGTSNILLGDVNSDGNINISDVILLLNYIFSDTYNSVGDLNEDQILNIADIILLVNFILDN